MIMSLMMPQLGDSNSAICQYELDAANKNLVYHDKGYKNDDKVNKVEIDNNLGVDI